LPLLVTPKARRDQRKEHAPSQKPPLNFVCQILLAVPGHGCMIVFVLVRQTCSTPRENALVRKMIAAESFDLCERS
jgi:hypothetical protein